MSSPGGWPAARHKIDQITRLLDVTCTPGGVHALRRWRPFSVSAFRLVHGLVAEGLSFETVLDVGANVGKFARAALGVWPEASVIAFEALPAAARQLGSARQLAGRVEVHAVALGSHDGTITFHPHEYSLSSSALSVPADLQARYAWAREGPPIEVPLQRLDSLLAGRRLPTPLLVKLDVQGFELEVLGGGLDTLRQASALVIEQAFDTVYEGQPLFGESHRFLESAGWSMVRILDWRREAGRVAEIDCLYAPSASMHRPAPLRRQHDHN